jgi:predicted NUDIX family NTP pyrophosphohydrolase
MPKQSAGILVYRLENDTLEVLLVHPGGPYFLKKDTGAWSIPKGEYTNEEPLTAARREFLEELGISIDGAFVQLTPVKQKAGKTVYAWAVDANPDISQTRSNTFAIEWPPKSGKMKEFPEVDKVEWFTIAEARLKINSAQAAFLDELISIVR